MKTIVMHRPGFLRTSGYALRNHQNIQRISAFWTVPLNSRSTQKRKYEQVSIKHQKLCASQMETLCSSNLQFDSLQQLNQDLIQENIVEFVAREAVLDEEYWTAAWLRAESHWENQRNERYVDNFIKKFAEQEFTGLKRRCKEQFGHKFTCIVTVKKEEGNAKNTIVGTLDLSILQFLHGETYPVEQVKAPLFCSINEKGNEKYGYIANLCVAKSARRQGIASNMLHFAIKSAKSNGMEQVFVHLRRDNKPAQELYQKLGFEVVEIASPQLSIEQTYLLGFRA